MFGEDELLTVNEVARRFKVSGGTIRRWAREGRLPIVLLPHRQGQKITYRFRAATIKSLLAETILVA